MASGYDASILYDASALYDVGETSGEPMQALYARSELLGSDTLAVVSGTAQLGITSRKSRALVVLNMLYPQKPVYLRSITLPTDPVAVAVNAAATHFYVRSTDALYKIAVGSSSIAASYELRSAGRAWMVPLASGNFIVPVDAGALVVSPVGELVSQGYAVMARPSFGAFNESTGYLYLHDRTSGTLGIFHLGADDSIGAISIASLAGTLGARSMRLTRDGLALLFVGPDTTLEFAITDPEAPALTTRTRYAGYSLTDIADIDGGFRYIGAELPIPDQLQNYDLPYGQDVVIYAPEITAMLALNSAQGRLMVWTP